MQTVFKYIYMFYTFRRPHFAGSNIHFIRTQTPGRPHLPDSPLRHLPNNYKTKVMDSIQPVVVT